MSKKQSGVGIINNKAVNKKRNKLFEDSESDEDDYHDNHQDDIVEHGAKDDHNFTNKVLASQTPQKDDGPAVKSNIVNKLFYKNEVA